MNSAEMKKPRKSKKHREAPEEQGLTFDGIILPQWQIIEKEDS